MSKNGSWPRASTAFRASPSACASCSRPSGRSSTSQRSDAFEEVGAADLVRLEVDVLFVGGAALAKLLQRETKTIPIVVSAPLLTRGAREHSCDEAEITKNKLSMGLDLKHPKGIELLMALWKISDVWMESSAPGTLERAGITNELALAVNPSLAPSIGEDTTAILSSMLGFSEHEIERLYDEKVVHRTEPFTKPQVEAVNP